VQARRRTSERARTADALSAQARALSAQLGEPLADVRGTVRERAPLSAESLRLLDVEVRALRAEHARRCVCYQWCPFMVSFLNGE
jgi:hypothetical protein